MHAVEKHHNFRRRVITQNNGAANRFDYDMAGAALLRRHAYGVLIPARFMATMLHLIITSVLINYKAEARDHRSFQSSIPPLRKQTVPFPLQQRPTR